jgi:UDP-2,4-diacetamido-2,4,6-trideoxy-beta-L-altropyranose hydrolase
MEVLFRVDASLESGAGHVMRCLTLADALRENGAVCRFVCRAHPGNLITFVQQNGYDVLVLPHVLQNLTVRPDEDDYTGWLGTTWQEDASQTLAVLATVGMQDWLVVDHYALDERWENAVRATSRRMLVIDDLANRCHHADILLDQTFGRDARHYLGLTNPACELRCGIEHVLLRAEFDHWRQRSLERRDPPSLRRIVISLGGVDKDNVSSEVLLALDHCKFLADTEICLVLGASSPWIEELRQLVQRLSSNVELRVAVSNMAECLSGCDLAVGAAGTSAWERCCLGVPTLMLVLADNQREIAARLTATGAAQLLLSGPGLQDVLVRTVSKLKTNPSCLLSMSQRASALVSRSGAGRLARNMVGVLA